MGHQRHQRQDHPGTNIRPEPSASTAVTLDIGPSPANRRPIILTFICILGTVGAIANLVRVFFGPPSIFGPWFLPVLAVSAIITIVTMVGVWMMRRWAVYTYIGLCIVGQIAWQIIAGVVVWEGVLMRCVVITLFLAYFKKMR